MTRPANMSLQTLILARFFSVASILYCLAYLNLLETIGTIQACLVVSAFIYLITGGHYTLYLVWHTLPRDLRGAYRYVRLLSQVYYYQKSNLTVPRVFKRTVKRFGNRPCLMFEDLQWSFSELDAYSNRVAHYFLREGFKPGDCIALFMDNRLVSLSPLCRDVCLDTY